MVSKNFFEELEKRNVSHSKEIVSINLDYADLPRKYARESEKHRALKKIAFQMLKEMGEPNPEYEFNYCDVYSPKLRIVIECGNTTANKILEELFRWCTANQLWILDYPNSEGKSELIKLKKEVEQNG